jgi:CRP-like cAMP-binding protein
MNAFKSSQFFSLKVLSPKVPFGIMRRILEREPYQYFRTGECLVRPGQLVEHIWYLKSGLAKRYYFDASGCEKVHDFYEAGSLLCVTQPLGMGERSEEYLVVLEDASLIPIAYQYGIALLKEHPDLYPWLIHFFCYTLYRRDCRIWLLGLPADKRYLSFIRLFPASRLLTKDIASYLNISAGGLSRIKGRV